MRQNVNLKVHPILIYTFFEKDCKMKASVLDLRYKMKEVLKALERHESVTLLYHGKKKGKIIPLVDENKSKARIKQISDHPFFGMDQRDQVTVGEQMNQIREPRYDL